MESNKNGKMRIISTNFDNKSIHKEMWCHPTIWQDNHILLLMKVNEEVPTNSQRPKEIKKYELRKSISRQFE